MAESCQRGYSDGMDPRVRRFIDDHSDNVRSVQEDVEPYIGMSLDERGERVSAVMRDLDMFLRAQPERREEILGREDRRSPESEALWLRLVADARRARAR